MCNDVHMSSLLPLPGQRCDGDPDVQQETCLGIKDTHPPRGSVLPTGSLTIMRLQVSGSLANSQALINERWRCNLQVYTLQALPHSETQRDGGSKRQTNVHSKVFSRAFRQVLTGCSYHQLPLIF